MLRDVSFSLEKGAIYVLMGTNGSGKTTLFNILTGFLNADHGVCILEEKKLDHISPHLINRNGITRSFQDLRLINELTVLQNVLLSFQGQTGENWWKALLPNHSVREQERLNIEMAIKILEKCFLTDVADSKAGEISYGQQKLLTLACCIANDAEVILLDEPVS
ncbi:MAG: ATP-binding cassette domain-containing protein, partial [Candidatus Paceibacterota bacterium]